MIVSMRVRGAQPSESDRVKVVGWPTRIAGRLLALAAISSVLAIVCRLAEARYIHSTLGVTPAVYDGQQPRLQEATNGLRLGEPQMTRRQDYEGDEAEAEADDDDDDQRAAASYRNQDDTGGAGNGDGDGANSARDSYGDNEPDGPYEETPVEQEGQADLERFFDDHLGASDREGMDKENLPTNLVPIRSGAFDPTALPINQYISNSAPPVAITAMPLPAVQSPSVRSDQHGRKASSNSQGEPQMSPSATVQTSFIRLPDEKMIITRQVTAARSPPRGPLKIETDSNDARGNSQGAAASSGPAHANLTASSGQVAANGRPLAAALSLPAFGLRISPTEATPGLTQPESFQSAASAASPAGLGVVATEDEDLERVYVTSDTDKPFKIDALGGFDPEANFVDVARELEVDLGDGVTRRATSDGRAPLKRRTSGQEHGGIAERAGGQPDAPHSSELENGPSNLHETIFNDPDTEKMYEDGSETDEVTFGQDDPYQTDLEAEMRQQELDKLRATLRAEKTDQSRPSDRADNMNVVVDDGLNGNKAQSDGPVAASASASADDDEEDIDADIDSEYRPEPSGDGQRDSMTGAASDSPAPNGPERSDIDDEGAWANDGADEMEVPSQLHQNSVLDKAAAAEAEAAAAAAAAAAASERVADGPNDKQDPDGGRDGSSGESGQTNEDGVENSRMPNADYMKSDFIEDDSGYAA